MTTIREQMESLVAEAWTRAEGSAVQFDPIKLSDAGAMISGHRITDDGGVLALTITILARDIYSAAQSGRNPILSAVRRIEAHVSAPPDTPRKPLKRT